MVLPEGIRHLRIFFVVLGNTEEKKCVTIKDVAKRGLWRICTL